jgi:hypothetical protein
MYSQPPTQHIHGRYAVFCQLKTTYRIALHLRPRQYQMIFEMRVDGWVRLVMHMLYKESIFVLYFSNAGHIIGVLGQYEVTA